jgi:hypothetical protein
MAGSHSVAVSVVHRQRVYGRYATNRLGVLHPASCFRVPDSARSDRQAGGANLPLCAHERHTEWPRPVQGSAAARQYGSAEVLKCGRCRSENAECRRAHVRTFELSHSRTLAELRCGLCHQLQNPSVDAALSWISPVMRPHTRMLYSLCDRITGEARGARQKDARRAERAKKTLGLTRRGLSTPPRKRARWGPRLCRGRGPQRASLARWGGRYQGQSP